MKNTKDKIMREEVVFCPFCEIEHTVNLVETPAQNEIKGQLINYVANFFVCSETGESFATGGMIDVSLLAARDAYRAKNDLLTSSQIKEIRNKFSLTQDEFSIILGFGEKQIARYETKHIQDIVHNDAMVSFEQSLYGVMQKLWRAGNKIKKTTQDKVIEAVNLLISQNQAENCLKNINATSSEKNILSGKTAFCFNRIKNMIKFFAKDIDDMGITKTNKLFFYSDALSYQKFGKAISGLQYVKDTHGAVPKGYTHLTEIKGLDVLVEPNRDNTQPTFTFTKNPGYDFEASLFSKGELEVLELVKNKFLNTSATKTSAIMHEEEAYLKTKDLDTISFDLCKNLKAFK